MRGCGSAELISPPSPLLRCGPWSFATEYPPVWRQRVENAQRPQTRMAPREDPPVAGVNLALFGQAQPQSTPAAKHGVERAAAHIGPLASAEIARADHYRDPLTPRPQAIIDVTE